VGTLGKKGESKSKIVNRTFIRIPQSKLLHTWNSKRMPSPPEIEKSLNKSLIVGRAQLDYVPAGAPLEKNS
jgi:hypothetical protein